MFFERYFDIISILFQYYFNIISISFRYYFDIISILFRYYFENNMLLYINSKRATSIYLHVMPFDYCRPNLIIKKYLTA